MATDPGVDVRRPRRADVTLALAAVVAVVGLGVSLRPQHTPVARATTSAAAVPRPELTPPSTRPTALVISDAYTSGSGLAGDVVLVRRQRPGWDGFARSPPNRAPDISAAEPPTGFTSTRARANQRRSASESPP